ncbi:hypothetical protein Tco_1153917 [Tanacetum coccineum]
MLSLASSTISFGTASSKSDSCLVPSHTRGPKVAARSIFEDFLKQPFIRADSISLDELKMRAASSCNGMPSPLHFDDALEHSLLNESAFSTQEELKRTTPRQIASFVFTPPDLERNSDVKTPLITCDVRKERLLIVNRVEIQKVPSKPTLPPISNYGVCKNILKAELKLLVAILFRPKRDKGAKDTALERTIKKNEKMPLQQIRDLGKLTNEREVARFSDKQFKLNGMALKKKKERRLNQSHDDSCIGSTEEWEIKKRRFRIIEGVHTLDDSRRHGTNMSRDFMPG